VLRSTENSESLLLIGNVARAATGLTLACAASPVALLCAAAFRSATTTRLTVITLSIIAGRVTTAARLFAAPVTTTIAFISILPHCVASCSDCRTQVVSWF
jgi:hypothetical protein